MRTAIMIVLLACLGIVPACASESQIPDQPDMLVGKEQTGFRAVLTKDVGVEQALSLVGQLQAKNATLRLQYPDHETIVDITNGDRSIIFAKEKARLREIDSHFNSDIPMEAVVKAQLKEDLALLESIGPNVRSVEFRTGINLKSALVARFETINRPIVVHNDSPGVGTAVSALTDWTGDAAYVPNGGTSTVSTSGTLQKFWLDDAAKNALNHTEDGLEMDTVITPKSAATCGSSGASSNMPDWYMDTEAFDDFTNPTSRTCSVGTNNAKSLQTWTLYWTWHPFASLATAGNPQIDVQYQPSKWCWWQDVINLDHCRALGAWCMCSRGDMPIEWLIRYNYNEAPGVEKSWIKN